MKERSTLLRALTLRKDNYTAKFHYVKILSQLKNARTEKKFFHLKTDFKEMAVLQSPDTSANVSCNKLFAAAARTL